MTDIADDIFEAMSCFQKSCAHALNERKGHIKHLGLMSSWRYPADRALTGRDERIWILVTATACTGANCLAV